MLTDLATGLLIRVPRVVFTSALERFVPCPPRNVSAETVRSALDAALAADETGRLAAYILDEQNRLRKHVTIFVDGRMIRDRNQLSDALVDNSEVYVMQALSGG